MVASQRTKPEVAKPAQVTIIYINRTITEVATDWICAVTGDNGLFQLSKVNNTVLTLTPIFSCTFPVISSRSRCRDLSPVWSGWWLCMTLPGVQTATCPFSREIISWSASTLTPSGAAVGSTEEKAFSLGLLLRAARVRRSHYIIKCFREDTFIVLPITW